MIEFKNFETIIELCKTTGKSVSTLVLSNESEALGLSENALREKLQEHINIMKEAARAGVKKGIKSNSGITGDWAYRLKERQKKSFAGDFLCEALFTALAISQINACMGRIVAAPTAGSCGILHGALITLQKYRGFSDEIYINGLLNAGCAGMIIAANATVAGAEGGCQSECGAAAAMTASAITEIEGGTPEECGAAIAHALKAQMGLICDPVAGLVEEPCIIRNATSVAVAVSCAEMAISGIRSLIPVDEVILAMKSVGKSMPESLRETADGGIAATPTGKRIAELLQNRL